MTRTARQKAIREARRQGLAPRPGCPNPHKRAYKDDEAVSYALRSARNSGRAISIYKCQCGNLHLTKQKQHTSIRRTT